MNEQKLEQQEQKKTSIFWRAYPLYLGVMLVLVILALLYVRDVLLEYEASQAEYAAKEYMQEFTEAIEEKRVEQILHLDRIGFSRFEDGAQIKAAYLEAVYTAPISYRLNAAGHSATQPIYDIYAGESCIAQLTFDMLREETKLAMLSIPQWGTGKFTPVLAQNTYYVDAPENFAIQVNGIALSEEEILRREEGVTRYELTGLCEKPIVTAQDVYGNAIEVVYNKMIISMLYEERLLTVPDTFTVSLGTPLTGISEEGMTTYHVAGATDLFPEIRDDLGQTVPCIVQDGKLITEYTQYELIVPSEYIVTADDIVLAPASEATVPETPQYIDGFTLSRYRLHCTGEPIFAVSTQEGEQVDLLKEKLESDSVWKHPSYLLTVPVNTYTLICPSNFNVRVNDILLTAEQIVKTEAIEQYRYVEEYMPMPQMVTYVLEALYTEPTIVFTCSDVVCDSRRVDNTITADEPPMLEALPASVSAQVDPLYIAQLWSKYMSKDIAGERYGYYTMREYLVKDSYFDQIAYSWATGIDITFISDHTLNTPPFTEERVEHIIFYGEDVFSCDVYFRKQLTLTKTGAKRTDVFYSRLYFIRIDDTEDGINNPHWVIADMYEIIE